MRTLEKKYILNQLLEQEGYVKFEQMDPDFFYHRYGGGIRIVDKSFALLFGWSYRFHYCYKIVAGACIVAGLDLKNRIEYCILVNHPEEIKSALGELKRLYYLYKIPIFVSYVEEEELPYYIKEKEYQINFRYNPDYSDYVYDMEAYMMQKGGCNRHKRQDLNHLKRNFQDLLYREYEPALKRDVLLVMERWCSRNSCDRCFFGCERIVLKRLLDHFCQGHYHCGLIYIKNRPVAFALFEQINRAEAACLIQKNSEPIRGLTYYLSYILCQALDQTRYLNLGEDMGMKGIREDKSGYHPDFLLKKYKLKIQICDQGE